MRILVIAGSLGLLMLGCTLPKLEPVPQDHMVLTMSGMLFSKPVKNVRALRFEDMVPQEVDYSCGAAALATLLNFYYQDEISEKDIVVEMLQQGDADRIRREGFSMLDLKSFAMRHGYAAAGYRLGPAVLDRLAIPAITIIDTRGYSHFVVLQGAQGKEVFLADPALGYRVMSRPEFMAEWTRAVLFVAAHKDPAYESPLTRLERRILAPLGEVYRMTDLGLADLAFPRQEF